MAILAPTMTEVERTGTTDPMTWTHIPVATPRAVVVAIVHGTSTTDHVVGVTYGGVALTRIVRAVDSATEPGAAELWFLGTGIPTGNQTVSVDLASATTDDIHGVAATFGANADTEVIDFDSISDNVANPSVTLQYNGRTACAIAALYGGGASPGSFTPNANCTTGQDFDLGAFYSEVIHQVTPGTADFAIGGTASSDDVAYVAAAISEKVTVFNQSVSGAITPAGALVKSSNKILAGAITPAGALLKTTTKLLSGVVSFVGALVKTTTKILSGAVSFVGALVTLKLFASTLDGSVSFAGALGKIATKTPSGSLGFVGNLVKTVSKVLSGELNFTGAMVKTTIKVLSGAVDFVGTNVKTTTKVLAGVSSFVGDLVAAKVGVVLQLVSGVLDFSGDTATELQEASDPTDSSLTHPDDVSNTTKII